MDLNAAGLQIGLFAVVALITGWLGDRVQRTWLALSEVQFELVRLRLDTADILTNISTGVLTVVDGGRLGYLNTAGERFLDLTLEQWHGAPILDVVADVAPGLADAFRRSMSGLRPGNRQTASVKRPTGDLVLGISTTVLESHKGEGPSVTAIFQDITDLERIQALNSRNERLEAVPELSASLAHEIKNPLASIRSAVEQFDSPSLPAEDRALLQRLVLPESDRLSRLLNEFLDFSVMRLGEKAKVDFTWVVRQAVELVKQHPDCEAEIRIEEEGLEGRLILPGDADLLHRLAFNLILNAVQFSGPGDTVQISLKDRSEEGLLPGSASQPVCLSVRDSGPGIPPGDVGHIFAPFYTTRKGGKRSRLGGRSSRRPGTRWGLVRRGGAEGRDSIRGPVAGHGHGRGFRAEATGGGMNEERRILLVDHLPEGVRATDVKPLVTDHLPPNPSMEVIERAYIQWVLSAEEGNKAKAAEVLGIDPSTLYRKLNRYGIEV